MMAFHFFPDEKKPLTNYVNNPKLSHWAAEAEKLLKELPQLKVWEVQYKGQGVANTCWLTGLTHKNEPYLFNFTIVPSNLNVEFRHSKYLPETMRDKLKWQTKNMNYADLKTFGHKEVVRISNIYLDRIMGDFDAGKIRRGGRSFAETIIRTSIQTIFPGQEVQSNIRLDELRSLKNKPLELDLLVPSEALAIEIQGPQHYGDGLSHYGSNNDLVFNDKWKKDWCCRNNLKLVWMDWEAVNNDLLRMTFEDRTNAIKKVISPFLSSKWSFLWWKMNNVYEFE